MNFSKSAPRRVGLALALAAAATSPAGAVGFAKAEIDAGGAVLSYALRDMDADGKLDVVIASRREEKGAVRRFLTVDLQQPGGKFRRGAETQVPDDVVAWGLGDFLGEGKPQFLYIASRLAAAVSAKTGQPVRIVEDHRFFFNKPETREFPFWDYTFDLNRDGRDDLILADASGYVAYMQDAPGKFVAGGRIDAEAIFAFDDSDAGYVESFDNDEMRRIQQERAKGPERQPSGGPPPAVARGTGMTALLPPIKTLRSMNRLRVADANGDGRLDLLVMKRDRLFVALQNEAGRFGDAPDIDWPIGPQGKTYAWDDTRLPVAEGDVDGDGRIDFVVAEVEPKDLTTKIRLYLTEPKGPPENPNQLLNVSGLGETPMLIDLNGDKALDLVYLTLRADKMVSLGKASTEEVEATLFAFLFDRKAGTFARRPDVKDEYSISILGDLDRDDSGEFTSLEGDFDGDGTRDEIRFENRGKLDVMLGKASGPDNATYSVATKPSFSHETALPRAMRIVDFDGDGRSDLVLRFGGSLHMLGSGGAAR